MKLKGWKAYAGGVLIVASAILSIVGHPEIAKALLSLGGAMGVIGLRHKLGRMHLKGAVDRTGFDPMEDLRNR